MSKPDWLWLASWMLWGLVITFLLGFILLRSSEQPTLILADQLRRVTAALATPDRTIRLQP
jgi:hypothetical protein